MEKLDGGWVVMSLPLTARPIRPVASRRKNLLAVGLLSLGILLIGGGILGGVVPGRVVLSAFLATLAGAFLLWRTGSEFDVLHPVRVFGVIWCGCLSLAALRLATYISDWDIVMWAYMGLALVSFVTGFGLMSNLVRAKESGLLATGKIERARGLSPDRGLVLALVCLVVGAAAMVYEYRLIGHVPILAPDIDEARFQLFGPASDPVQGQIGLHLVNQLLLLVKYAVYLSVILLLQKYRKSKARVALLLAMIVFGFLAYSSRGGRWYVFEQVVVVGALFHYLRWPLSRKHLLTGAVTLLLFLSFASYIRLLLGYRPAYAHQMVEGFSSLPQGELWDVPAHGYFACTASFEVFYRLTQDLPGQGHPASGYMFWFLRYLVPRQNLQELTSRLYGAEMLVPTFLGEFYADFGVWGILCGPLIIGVGYGYLYTKSRRIKDIWWLLVLCLSLPHLAVLVYMNAFSYHLTWIVDFSVMSVLVWLARSKLDHRASAVERFGLRRAGAH